MPIIPILYCTESSDAVVPLEIDFQLLGYMVVAFESASIGEHVRLPGGQSATSCAAQGIQNMGLPDIETIPGKTKGKH